MSENGSPPIEPVVVVNPEQLQLIADDILRQMNHLEWLRMLAVTLEQAPARRGIPNTPFRAGAVERIRMAVKFIELLQRDLRDAKRRIAGLESDIRQLKLVLNNLDPPEDGR